MWSSLRCEDASRGWTCLAGVLALLILIAGCSSSRSSAITASTNGSPALANLKVLSTDVTVQANGSSDAANGITGEELSVGDEVRTSPTGFAEVAFFDGSLTRIDHAAEFSVVELQNSDAAKVVHTSLNAGRSWNRIEKLSQSQTWQMDTPVASATVRGTAFVADCSVPTPNACLFQVAEGTVELRLPDATVVTLNAGQQITLVKDQPPPQPTNATVAAILADPWVVQNVTLDHASGQPDIQQSAAAGGVLNGTYTLDSTLRCGQNQVVSTDQATLVVSDGQATLTWGTPQSFFDSTFRGTITQQGGSFQLDSHPSQFMGLHLDGTVTNGGSSLSGTGTVGQGTQYSDCLITFTGTSGSNATTTTDTGPGSTGTAGAPPCTRDAVQAALPAGQVLHDDPRCSGNWATASPTVLNAAGQSQYDITVLLRQNGEGWQVADRSTYCSNGSVPAAIYQQACQTN